MDTARLLYGEPAELRRLQLLAFKCYQNHRKYFAETGAADRG
jgi:hypothetical protein